MELDGDMPTEGAGTMSDSTARARIAELRAMLASTPGGVVIRADLFRALPALLDVADTADAALRTWDAWSHGSARFDARDMQEPIEHLRAALARLGAR